MRTLILTVEKDVCLNRDIWVVEEVGEKKQELKDLFGTNKIPTAFFATMPSAQVKNRIQALNPGAEVMIK
jgi:hypothetical protein